MNENQSISVLQAGYQRVCEQIEAAARQAGRDPGEIQLVVVTKGHPAASVRAAFQAGMRLFGENYVEEGVKKIAALQAAGEAAKWHMIGHVQSRKAALVAEHFDWVHSVDSFKLAGRLDRFEGEPHRKLPILLECNVSGELSKFGWQAWDETDWPALADEIGALLDLGQLDLRGLMTMAPFFDSPEPARPFFERLRRLRDFLSGRLGRMLPDLSMGMSGDFPAAVQEGATLVRIGTAIMGPRPAA